ncbi:MAG: nuclear transport factor 2 family protein [Bacteroidota bacterium]
MRKYLFLALLIVYPVTVAAQGTEEDQIREAIGKYDVGTAYNHADMVLEAFMPGADMFLENRDQELWIMKIEDYAGRIANQEAGKFNGRLTNTLAIDRFGNIATAKLEVIIPTMGRRFIDMLLLKKLDDGWKIISKTATSEPSPRTGKKVLMVVSSATQQGDSALPAGNSFAELVIAYDEYYKAGYHIDVVSPKGGKVPLAYVNPADSLESQYLYNADFMYAMANTKTPAEINPDAYQIVQFTGGSAPIFDIPQHQALQNIAMHIYEKNNGVIAAVCHGTAALVNLKTSNGNYLVAGKQVNGVPDILERKDLPHYKQYPFIIEDLLVERGGIFRHAEIATPHMEVDGRLVTGQNSLSSAMVTRKSIEISQRKENEDS